MSAIKELIPEVIKTGDYATCSLQIPKGVAGEVPLLLTMTNAHCETKRQGWYGTRVHCCVLWDNGETLSHIGHKEFEMEKGQTQLAVEICGWLISLGAGGAMWIEQVESALQEMIPV